jgi:hypothetical protein
MKQDVNYLEDNKKQTVTSFSLSLQVSANTVPSSQNALPSNLNLLHVK